MSLEFSTPIKVTLWVLLCIVSLSYLLSLFYLIIHRNSKTLEKRPIFITILSSIFLFLYGFVPLYYALNLSKIPCIIPIFHGNIVLDLAKHIYLTRVWITFFLCKLEKEKEQKKQGIFSRYRHLSASFVSFLFYCVFLTIIANLHTIYVLFDNEIITDSVNDVEMCREYHPVFGTLALTQAVKAILFLIVILLFYYLLRGHQDNFGLFLEFRISAIIILTYFIVWGSRKVSASALEFNQNVFPYSAFCTAFMLLGFYYTIILLPFFHSKNIIASKYNVPYDNALNSEINDNRIPFYQFLASENNRKLLHEYLVRGFCVENILFLEAVVELRKKFTLSHDYNTHELSLWRPSLTHLAWENDINEENQPLLGYIPPLDDIKSPNLHLIVSLYYTFLDKHSSLEVNISHTTNMSAQSAVYQIIKECEENDNKVPEYFIKLRPFDMAYNEVYSLLNNDIWPVFFYVWDESVGFRNHGSASVLNIP